MSVIDTSFEVLGQMSLDQGQLPGDYCICDGRLFQVHPEGHEDEDEILVGFNPDLGRMSTEGCVTRLSFEALNLETAAGDVPNLMGKVSAPPGVGRFNQFKAAQKHGAGQRWRGDLRL